MSATTAAALVLAAAIAVVVPLLVRARRERVRTLEELSRQGPTPSPTLEVLRGAGAEVPPEVAAAISYAAGEAPPPGPLPDPAPPAPPATADPAALAFTPPPGEYLRLVSSQPAVPPPPPRRPEDALAALVAGVALPCGLVPLTFSGPAAHRVVLATTDASAEEVAPALADALEAAGTTVEVVADDTARLRRGGVEGHLVVHPAPSAVVDAAGRPRFPTAPDGSVVVELVLG